MELQERTTKVRGRIETVIRHTGDPKWKYTQSGMAALQLQSGLELLPKLFGGVEVADERVVDFIVYQIYRNRQYIENGRWNPSWIFSNNALEKYKVQFMDEKGKSGMRYYIDKWLDEYELSRGQLVSMIAKQKPNPLRNMVYMESEEPIKRRFFNTEMGFVLCQQHTTGWSPLSDSCTKCNRWVECGKLTAEKYPELMRFRKEAYGNKKDR